MRRVWLIRNHHSLTSAVFSTGLLLIVAIFVFVAHRSEVPTIEFPDEGTTAAEAEVPMNSQPGVSYVGSQACVECHRDQYGSYLDTTHSITARKTNVQEEPGPATFKHEFSGHTYQVAHQDGKLLHREIMHGSQGDQRHRRDFQT